MYCLYILTSISTKRLYVGVTGNITRRLSEHNKGYSFSSKPYRPWQIAYIERYHTLSEARKRERFIKSLKSRRIIIKYIINSPDVRLTPQSGVRATRPLRVGVQPLDRPLPSISECTGGPDSRIIAVCGSRRNITVYNINYKLLKITHDISRKNKQTATGKRTT